SGSWADETAFIQFLTPVLRTRNNAVSPRDRDLVALPADPAGDPRCAARPERGPAVATTPILMEKLLETVIRNKASDIHISVGHPPVIRHHGRLKKLDTKNLEAEDTTGLMKSIPPDRCQQELQEKGGADFAIEYTDGVRFRCAIFKQKGSIAMVLRRIPSQILSFEHISMPDAIRSPIRNPQGPAPVTGPSG